MKKIMIVVVLMLFCCGCGDEAENTIVSFKGGCLTKEDVVAHYNKLKRKNKYRNNPDTLTPEFIFDHALNMEMIIEKGLEEKLHLVPWIREEIHGFMSDLFLKTMQERLVPEIDKKGITEQEMRRFYEENKEKYQKKALYGVRIVKTDDQEKTASVMSEIRSGMISFEGAAEKYSKDEKSKTNGGFIGMRSLDKFQDNWRNVIEKLRLNEIYGPAEIDRGWYLLELTQKTEQHQYTYEEKQAYIRNDVLHKKYRDEWQKTYDRLKNKFEVKINEQKLQEFYKGFVASSEDVVDPGNRD